MRQVTESPDLTIDRVRATSDVKEKLAIAGLIRRPSHDHEIKEECGNCIYFLSNHEFCDLPELQIPVAADWWCRLWRV